MLIKLIYHKYGVSATFNVVDLSSFDAGDGWDSRTNPSQEGENDMNHDQGISIPQGPVTRTRVKKLQQILYTYIQAIVISSKEILEIVGDLPCMLCKVELQGRDALNAL